MRALLSALAFIPLLGCSQEDLLQKFSSPEDQATAKNYVDLLRARNFDEIESALDPSIRSENIRETMTRMADLMPTEAPSSIKLVGAQTFYAPGAKTINTT